MKTSKNSEAKTTPPLMTKGFNLKRWISASVVFLLVQVGFGQAPKELKTIFEVAGQDSGALLGSYVKGVGDLNRDGYADVAVSAPGKLLTYLYYGGKTMSQKPSLTFAGGGMIVSGDFNGDGWIDLAIERYFKDTALVYFGGQQMDTIPDLVLYAENKYDGFGHNSLAVGDINGDGIVDLLVGAAAYPYADTITNNYWRGRIYVYAGGKTLDTIPTITITGDTARTLLSSDLAVGDINGDGKNDIVALGFNELSSSANEQFYCFSVFLGDSAFQLKRNYYVDSRQVPGGFKHHIASFDADGDGIDDILVNKIYIFKGGTHFDTVPTYYVAPPDNDTSNFGSYSWVDGGGDFNHDGIKDILLTSTQGYFGGVPGVNIMLGSRTSPGQYKAYRIFSDYSRYALNGRPENAGDVNGDGVDDIIIGAPFEPSFYVRGFFGIYSGDTALVTHVRKQEEESLKDFDLQQNYPNPFNPVTIIEYTLSKQERVTIRIYDSLGREVILLVNNEEQTAGTHKLRWRGTDDHGNRVSSGIYYYQLTTPNGGQTKIAINIK